MKVRITLFIFTFGLWAIHSKLMLTPGSVFKGPCTVQGIEPRSAACEASALPLFLLLLRPLKVGITFCLFLMPKGSTA